MEHTISTRNNGVILRLPKVRTVTGKNGFYFAGAKLFNNLPSDIRKADSLKKFKEELNKHFK